MDADDLELWEVAGHGIERDRAAYGAQRVGGVVDHRLPDLQLHRYVELHTFGVEGVPLCMVRREFEPMRVEMCADKAVLGNGSRKLADARHTLGRVEAGEAVEAIRIRLHRLRHQAIVDVVTRGVTEPADLGGDKEGLLYPGRIHARDHAPQADALEDLALDPHLGRVKAGAVRSAGQGLRRPDVDHRVDCTNFFHVVAPNPSSRAMVSRSNSFAPSPKV